jgi:transposase
LYPKPNAEKKLHWARKMHKELYKAAIANRRTQYERFGHSDSYYEQQNSLPAFKEVWTEYKQLGSQALQATLKRVDLAYQSFFKGIATEELNLKGMTKKAKKSSKRKAQKTGLNRSMLDVGINNLTKAIEYKLQEAGGFLVYVPTKTVKPSQTCPSCGHQKKKDLSEPVHHCSECGVTYDRDVAAAMVMLSRALFNLRPQSWRRNPYFYPSSYGRLEANFFVEATETHRSRK